MFKFFDSVNKIFTSTFKGKNKKFICENTIKGTQISDLMQNKILLKISAVANEKLDIIYSYHNNFNDINQNDIFIGISNYRLFKLEKNYIQSVNISEIDDVNHKQNNIFRWDFIECQMGDKRIESFSIFHKTTCAYFCGYLNSLIKLNLYEIINSIQHHESELSQSLNEHKFNNDEISEPGLYDYTDNKNNNNGNIENGNEVKNENKDRAEDQDKNKDENKSS